MQDEWGIFPKVVDSTLKIMEKKRVVFKLYISALEFYMCQCFDLLNQNAPINVDRDTGPRASTQVEIKKIKDL